MLLKGEERRMPMTALTAALVGARECPGEAGAAAGGGEVKGETGDSVILSGGA
jgi:hypothetical protein